MTSSHKRVVVFVLAEREIREAAAQFFKGLAKPGISALTTLAKVVAENRFIHFWRHVLRQCVPRQPGFGELPVRGGALFQFIAFPNPRFDHRHDPRLRELLAAGLHNPFSPDGSSLSSHAAGFPAASRLPALIVGSRDLSWPTLMRAMASASLVRAELLVG